MSYASDVKEELYAVIDKARHCQIAELAAIVGLSNKTKEVGGKKVIVPEGDQDNLYKKYSVLTKKLNDYYDYDNPLITQQTCCKRAYIRGAFLAVGSVSDPSKSYHLEIVCRDERQAHFLAGLLDSFDITAKMIRRKNYHVLYVKDGSVIVETLNVMGAHVALMDFENTRILKEISNSVNRKVNCETANIGKTVNAAQRQIDDIRYLMSVDAFDDLPAELKEMAELRISHPEATLQELGELSTPPLGKSGVNHRLRKLSRIAQDLI